MLGATIYIIWKERKARVHAGRQRRLVREFNEIILITVN